MKLALAFLLLLSGLTFATDKSLGAERDAAVRLQILLDNRLFGPGFIDGKPGTFTKRALVSYNRSQGRDEADTAAAQAEADEEITHTYVTVTVPRASSKFVNTSLPHKREAQAKVRALHYRSYFEFMAERYHTSESVLYELNGKNTTWALRPGHTVVVPNVEPFKIEDLKPGRSHKGDAPYLAQRRIVISPEEKQVQIFEPAPNLVASNGGISSSEEHYRLVASFPTTPGQERYIHRGTWTLKNCIEWPTWRYDKQMLKQGKRGKNALLIPGGPNNPVGVVWAGLSKSGIGIHGTDNPRTIGRARSSGCYRLANWDVARLFTVVRPGATVIVE